MDKRILINKIDETASRLHLKLFGEEPGLSAFLFHGVFKDDREMGYNHIVPQERMTVDRFRQFLDHFLSHQYKFISPDSLQNGLADESACYGLITFDDGYFNNIQIAEVLAEYKVPAVFFYSTGYTREGKKFWSDVLYHRRKQQGRSDLAILEEIISLKKLKTAAVEERLIKEFGNNVLQPLGDIDRPMTAGELASFARMPFVYLGNHTHQHEILTNLSEEETTDELETSQRLLSEITGIDPWIISYPNGSFSENAIRLSVQKGLTTGITTIQQKNKLPLKPGRNGQTVLNRFNPAFGVDGRSNFDLLRSSLQVKTQLKKWLQ